MIAVSQKSVYWDEIARSFGALGPPLRPSGEDIRLQEGALAQWSAEHPGETFRTILLGMTPEIGAMRLPEGCSLLAVDRSMGMAKRVWPGNIENQRWAVCGDWLTLPQPRESCAAVIGDGSMNCVRYPDGLRKLAATIRAVLRPDGQLLVRCFIRPDIPEAPENILSDLMQSRIPSVNHLKLRLMMATQSTVEAGVLVSDIYETWAGWAIDENELMKRTGWQKSEIEILNCYKDQDVVHTFPSLSEMRAGLDEFFHEARMATPGYELGEYCPHFVFRRRPGS